MCCPAPSRSTLRRKRPLGTALAVAKTLEIETTTRSCQQPKPAAPLHPLAQQYQLELAQRRTELGQFHPSVAETLNALGLVHNHMACDPASALRCHTEALRILRRNAPYVRSLELDVAMTLSDVGDVHHKMGQYEDASAAYRCALETFAAAGKGEEHPRVVSTANRLSRLQRGSVV